MSRNATNATEIKMYRFIIMILILDADEYIIAYGYFTTANTPSAAASTAAIFVFRFARLTRFDNFW